MGARLSPITSADVPDVARFLATHLNQRVPADRWSRALSVPWDVAQPNHGFHLREQDGTVVGAYLAYYSEQRVGGRLERSATSARGASWRATAPRGPAC